MIVIAFSSSCACRTVLTFFPRPINTSYARFDDKFGLAKPEIGASTDECVQKGRTRKPIAKRREKYNRDQSKFILHIGKQHRNERSERKIYGQIHIYTCCEWRSVDCNKSINRIFRVVSMRINYDYSLALLSLFLFESDFLLFFRSLLVCFVTVTIEFTRSQVDYRRGMNKALEHEAKKRSMNYASSQLFHTTKRFRACSF